LQFAARLPWLTNLQLRSPLDALWLVNFVPPALLSLSLTVRLVFSERDAKISVEKCAALTGVLAHVVAASPPQLRCSELVCLRGRQRLLVPSVLLSPLARWVSLTDLRIDVPWEDVVAQQTLCGMLQLRAMRWGDTWISTEPDRWPRSALKQLTAGEVGVDYPRLESLGHMVAISDAVLTL